MNLLSNPRPPPAPLPLVEEECRTSANSSAG
jgi:hypothetical protein